MPAKSVSEWSDEELSRVIAEHVFPEQHWRNQYRDFVSDPAMVLMLLEKLLERDVVTIVKAPKGPCYMIGPSYMPQRVKPSLGRAIAERYSSRIGGEMKWRVGAKVPRNLYRRDEPIAMLATEELAHELAERLNQSEAYKEQVKLAREALVRAHNCATLDDFTKKCNGCHVSVMLAKLAPAEQEKG